MELSKAITIFRDKAAQTDLNVSYPNLFNKKERNASSMIFSKPISMHPRIRQMKPLRTQGSMGRRKDWERSSIPLNTTQYSDSKILVYEGETVQAGEKIGKFGSTGISSGNHLQKSENRKRFNSFRRWSRVNGNGNKNLVPNSDSIFFLTPRWNSFRCRKTICNVYSVYFLVLPALIWNYCQICFRSIYLFQSGFKLYKILII